MYYIPMAVSGKRGKTHQFNSTPTPGQQKLGPGPLGPWPTWTLGPLGPWALLDPGAIWALAHSGPGTCALGPLGHRPTGGGGQKWPKTLSS